MNQITVSTVATSRANASRVFALLKDGSSWPAWAMFDSFELEQAGAVDKYGVGSIRVLSTRVSRARENVIEVIPDRRFSYRLLSGFPLDDYVAAVDLTPVANGGTTICWRATFCPRHVGTGWFWRLFIAHVLSRTARQLAAAAERLDRCEATGA